MSVKYETEIKKKLIDDVDAVKNDFKDYLFRGVPDIAVLGLISLVMVLVETMCTRLEEIVFVQLLIASGALAISAMVYYVTIYPKWDKTYAEYKARKLCKSLNYYKEETKVLLTALIFMKTKQPKTKLSIVYKLEPKTFEKEKLLQLLYEHS